MRTFDLIIIGNGAIGHAVAHAVMLAAPQISIALVGEKTRPLAASVAAGAMLGAYSEVTANQLETASGRAKLAESLAAARMWPTWLEGLNALIPSENRVSIRPGDASIIHARMLCRASDFRLLLDSRPDWREIETEHGSGPVRPTGPEPDAGRGRLSR